MTCTFSRGIVCPVALGHRTTLRGPHPVFSLMAQGWSHGVPEMELGASLWSSPQPFEQTAGCSCKGPGFLLLTHLQGWSHSTSCTILACIQENRFPTSLCVVCAEDLVPFPKATTVGRSLKDSLSPVSEVKEGLSTTTFRPTSRGPQAGA